MSARPFALRTFHAPFMRYHLVQEVVLLGRMPTCDIVIDDRSVSRRHAELRTRATGVEICDLNSRNGTYFGALRIHTDLAVPGQIAKFGEIEFIFEISNPSEEETVDPNGTTGCVDQQLVTCEASLSTAQHRVMKSVLEGHSEKEIAKLIYLSRHTVHNHIKEIYRKFEVHSRAQLLALFRYQSTEKGSRKPGCG